MAKVLHVFSAHLTFRMFWKHKCYKYGCCGDCHMPNMWCIQTEMTDDGVIVWKMSRNLYMFYANQFRKPVLSALPVDLYSYSWPWTDQMPLAAYKSITSESHIFGSRVLNGQIWHEWSLHKSLLQNLYKDILSCWSAWQRAIRTVGCESASSWNT